MISYYERFDRFRVDVYHIYFYLFSLSTAEVRVLQNTTKDFYKFDKADTVNQGLCSVCDLFTTRTNQSGSKETALISKETIAID